MGGSLHLFSGYIIGRGRQRTKSGGSKQQSTAAAASDIDIAEEQVVLAAQWSRYKLDIMILNQFT